MYDEIRYTKITIRKKFEVELFGYRRQKNINAAFSSIQKRISFFPCEIINYNQSQAAPDIQCMTKFDIPKSQ